MELVLMNGLVYIGLAVVLTLGFLGGVMVSPFHILPITRNHFQRSLPALMPSIADHSLSSLSITRPY